MTSIHILALDTTRKGGAGVYTANLITNLTRMGHQVTLVCHESTTAIQQICEVHELPRIRKDRRFGTWRFDAYLQIRDYETMLRALKLDRPDVIIGSAQPMIIPYLKIHPGCPLVYIPHSLVAPIEIASYNHAGRIQRWAAINAYHYMEKACLANADITIRFTEAASDAIKAHYGKHCTAEVKVLTMPIAIPEETPKHFSQETTRFLTIGRLIKSKNIALLLKILANHLDQAWQLDVVGDGDEKESLMHLSEKLKISDRVSFYGQRDDIDNFYRDADIFLFPSLLESYALVLIEAMSWGLPIIAFESDGEKFINVSKQVIEDGFDGFLVKDENQFEVKIMSILDKKINLASIGTNARNTVKNRNSWDIHALKINEILDKYTKKAPSK